MRQLLITSIRRTLLGSGPISGLFDQVGQGLALVYNTSLSREEVEGRIRVGELPPAEVIISSSGTEAHYFPSGESVERWDAVVGPGFDVREVERIVAGHGLIPRPAQQQASRKVGFTVEQGTDPDLGAVDLRLRSAGLHANLVQTSSIGIDVVPAGIDKGTAAWYVGNLPHYDDHTVIVAGSVPGDIPMFMQDFLGIAPGNATHGIMRLRRRPRLRGRIYHATESHLAGVLEGLRFWSARPAQPFSSESVLETLTEPA